MSESDILVRRAASGDAAAFGALVRLHQSRLRGFLLRLTRGDSALADDLAQESFIAAHQKISQYRGEGSFAGWLYAIAWSRFRMAARARRLESLDEEDAGGWSPHAGSDAKLDLEKTMARLSAPERAGLTLCFALGLSHEEAALILEIPLGTLKSHVARGREKLKTMLTAWERNDGR